MIDPPRRLVPDKRRPHSIDECFRLVEEHAPDGWQLVELCFLPPEAARGIRGEWYASAGPPTDPLGDYDEGTGSTPIRALLALARRLHERKHGVGRPSKPFVPPPLLRHRDVESPYRSPDTSVPASVAS